MKSVGIAGQFRQVRLAEADEKLVFEITSDPQNRTVHVVRTSREADGRVKEIASGFGELDEALKWVDSDPRRFEHPRLMLEHKETIRGLFEHFPASE